MMVNKAYDDKGDDAFDTHSGKSCRISADTYPKIS